MLLARSLLEFPLTLTLSLQGRVNCRGFPKGEGTVVAVSPGEMLPSRQGKCCRLARGNVAVLQWKEGQGTGSTAVSFFPLPLRERVRVRGGGQNSSWLIAHRKIRSTFYVQCSTFKKTDSYFDTCFLNCN